MRHDHLIRSFPPIAGAGARILILGSMPGKISLARNQYYAHPRNAFWSIMHHLFDIPSELAYRQRTELLVVRRIALWDVLAACHRIGSLDAAISDGRANDFGAFYAAHPHIERVFFNGRESEKIYRRDVIPTLERRWARLPFRYLLSTSPAAAVPLEEKIRRWRAVMTAERLAGG